MPSGSEEAKFELSGNQITALYVFLKEHEESLDRECRSVLNRLEKAVHGMYSIEELEQILHRSRKGR